LNDNGIMSGRGMFHFDVVVFLQVVLSGGL
jgi:hypothetical protein